MGMPDVRGSVVRARPARMPTTGNTAIRVIRKHCMSNTTPRRVRKVLLKDAGTNVVKIINFHHKIKN